jgi:predicted NBD/HSP70 family sugar kinase
VKIVVLDIGGSSLKLWTPLSTDPIKIETGEDFTPHHLVEAGRNCFGDVLPDRISIGYPGIVRWGRPAVEPVNLGRGWVGFDFAHAFDRPVRILNDAEMQALGGYEGGRMLYLGLGTGVGTTLITEAGINQISLGLLPFKDGKPFEAFLTKDAQQEIGLAAWREHVAEAAVLLKRAVQADYVLIGGGAVSDLDAMPQGCRRGGNVDAYFGGLRMWEDIGVRSTVLGRPP